MALPWVKDSFISKSVANNAIFRQYDYPIFEVYEEKRIKFLEGSFVGSAIR